MGARYSDPGIFVIAPNSARRGLYGGAGRHHRPANIDVVENGEWAIPEAVIGDPVGDVNHGASKRDGDAPGKREMFIEDGNLRHRALYKGLEFIARLPDAIAFQPGRRR